MIGENAKVSFFERPNVEKGIVDVGQGIPFGIERVTNPSVGIGGVYGTWGDSYDNETLPFFLEQRLGRPLSPNEKLNIAVIGIAHQGKYNLDNVAGENIVALCDIDDDYLRAEAQRFPMAATYNDYRKLLERKDIDAVVIATPDHTHAIITAAILIGASTGPHHGSGSKNKMSQSSSDFGQPDMRRKNT